LPDRCERGAQEEVVALDDREVPDRAVATDDGFDWAQISFIMHCIGELMLAMATWSGRMNGASAA
jgi:hypothetical protein